MAESNQEWEDEDESSALDNEDEEGLLENEEELDAVAAEHNAPGHHHVSLAWNALEYHFHEKSANWYIAVFIVVGTVAALSAIYGNYLLSTLSILAGFAIGLHGARRPRVVEMKIDDHGLRVGHRLFRYKQMKSFCLLRHPQEGTFLSVELDSMLTPRTSILLGDADPQDIHDALILRVPYEEYEESILDMLLRAVGF
jgi:hypothetical protein